MEVKQKTTSFSGQNFQGELELGKDSLKINVSEFSKRVFYYSEIRRDIMQRQSKRFRFFSKLESLYDELRFNKKLKINDENSLIIPIQVTYKNEVKDDPIEIPLLQNNNDNDKIQNFCQTIQRLTKKIKMQQLLLPQHTIFKADQTNSKFFRFNENTLTMLGKNTYKNYLSSCCIPKNGSFYFLVKILKTATKKIGIGLIEKEKKQICIRQSYYKQIPCLFLDKGQLYSPKLYDPTKISLKNVEVGQIIKIVIDTNCQEIQWFVNGKFTCKLLISELLKKQLFPFVSMYSQGDMVQFIDQ